MSIITKLVLFHRIKEIRRKRNVSASEYHESNRGSLYGFQKINFYLARAWDDPLKSKNEKEGIKEQLSSQVYKIALLSKKSMETPKLSCFWAIYYHKNLKPIFFFLFLKKSKNFSDERAHKQVPWKFLYEKSRCKFAQIEKKKITFIGLV